MNTLPVVRFLSMIIASLDRFLSIINSTPIAESRSFDKKVATDAEYKEFFRKKFKKPIDKRKRNDIIMITVIVIERRRRYEEEQQEA